MNDTDSGALSLKLTPTSGCFGAPECCSAQRFSFLSADSSGSPDGKLHFEWRVITSGPCDLPTTYVLVIGVTCVMPVGEPISRVISPCVISSS